VLAVAAAGAWLGYFRPNGVGWRTSTQKEPLGSARKVPLSGAYNVDFRTTVGQKGLDPFLSLAFSGPLQLRRLDLQDRFVLRAVFSGSLLDLKGLQHTTHSSGSETQVQNQLGTALQRAFLLEFSAGGDFLGVRTNTRDMPIAAELWQALGTSLQFKSSQASGTWESSEVDGIGKYAASYRWLDSRTVEKTKLRYTSLNSPKIEYSAPECTVRYSFSDDSVLSLLVLHESVESKREGPIPGFHSVTDIKLELTKLLDSPSSLDESEWRRLAGNPLIPPGQKDSQALAAELDAQKIGGRTLPGMLAELAARGNTQTASKEDREQFGRAYVALVAYIRQKPGACQELSKEILSNRTLAASLINALRDSSTPEAQKAMRDLIPDGQGLSPQLRGLLVQGLSLVKTPTAETVAELTALQSDPKFSTQATYGLGSNAHHLSATDPALSQSIVDTLVNGLSSAGNNGKKMTFLTALGAAGSPRTLSVIEGYANDADDGVRAASAQGLRRILGQDADSLLAKLALDGNDNVQFSALDAISERSPSGTLVDSLSQVGLSDNSVKNRISAVRALERWRTEEPRAVGALMQIGSAPNQNPEVVRLTQTLLGNPASGK
jgi:hypothetical protein